MKIKQPVRRGEAEDIPPARTDENPDVLILDEPTSALDRSSRKRLGEYLQSIRKEKIIIISTHDKAFIEICDEEVSVTSLMHN